MSEHIWSELYEYAVNAFDGQTPRAQDEQASIDAFKRNPTLVRRKVDEVAADLAASKIRWGWSTLAAVVQQLPARDVVVSDGNERERAVAKAEAWIANAGLHYDRESEVEDELFGDTGTLRSYRGDELLRRRLLERWQAVKGRGAQVERERDERAAAYVESRARVAGKLAGLKAKRDAAAEEDVKRKLRERTEVKTR